MNIIQQISPAVSGLIATKAADIALQYANIPTPWTLMAGGVVGLGVAYYLSRDSAAPETEGNGATGFPDFALAPLVPPSSSQAPHYTTPQRRPAPSMGRPPANFYEREADIINRVLVHHGIKAQIEWSHPNNIVRAPHWVIYRLAQTGMLRAIDIERITSDLARDINNLSRRNRYGKVYARYIDQPQSLMVSRARQKSLSWSDRDWERRPMSSCLGYTWQHGPQAQPVVLDMYGTSSTHNVVSFFGSQGFGKSTLLHTVILGLMETTSPDELELYLVDCDANDFERYSELPHVRYITFSQGKTLDLLATFEKWAQEEWDGVHRVLVIDELQMFTSVQPYSESAVPMIKTIMETGRKHGIRVITATQNPNRENYPQDMKGVTQVFGAVYTAYDRYLSSQIGLPGASQLQGRNDIVYRAPETGVTNLTGFALTEREINAEIAALAQKWGSHTAQTLDIEPELVEHKTPEEKEIAMQAERLWEKIKEWYDFDNDTWYKGKQAEAGRYVLPSWHSNPHYYRRLQTILNYGLENFKGEQS